MVDVCLLYTSQLEGLRKLGDPHAFARGYYEEGIDEILYLDIVASLYERNNLSHIVRRTTGDVFIPITVGGGLRSVEDVRGILQQGADKAAINTAAVKDPSLITRVAEAYGSQCMVLSIPVSYTHLIAIEARTNPRCQMSNMPKRYWNLLTEMQEEEDDRAALAAAGAAGALRPRAEYGTIEAENAAGAGDDAPRG